MITINLSKPHGKLDKALLFRLKGPVCSGLACQRPGVRVSMGSFPIHSPSIPSSSSTPLSPSLPLLFLTPLLSPTSLGSHYLRARTAPAGGEMVEGTDRN